MSGDGPYTIVMPDDGWDERAVQFRCEFCDRVLTHRSVYLNMDALLEIGLTQAEFAHEIHLNDHHPAHVTYDEGQAKWVKVCLCAGDGCTVMDVNGERWTM